MHWIHFTDEGQLQKIIVRSQEKFQVIFKYCTNCGLSESILDRLKKDCCPKHVDFHFLDLVANEEISNKISETFHIPHQSPQILLIKDGACIFHESHAGISLDEIMEHAMVAA